VLERFRKWIRDLFTQVVIVEDEETFDDLRGTSVAMKGLTRRRLKRKPEKVVIRPSERFVWGMTALIVALIGSIVLEGVYIAVKGELSVEIWTVVAGLIGSFTTAFLLGKT